MPGLNINICFWYIDKSLIEEIIGILQGGNYDPVYCSCKDDSKLKSRLSQGDIDLIIADFDLPEALRNTIEEAHSKFAFHIPFIYIVGEKSEAKAAEALKRGVWDYLLKSHLVKLVPTVYSSQKYGKVLKRSNKIQSELKESESKYYSVFNTVKDAIVIIDPETLTILDFNESLHTLFRADLNWEKGEVISWLTAEDGNYSKSKLEKAELQLGESNSVNFQSLNTRVNGDVFWAENTLSLFGIGDGIQYVLVIRDIQEQKIMQESLQKSQETFRNLAENSPDIIMRFDKQYRHIYVNQTVVEQLKIPTEAFINKTHHEMGIFPEGMISFWEEAIQAVFESGNPNRVEFDLPTEKSVLSFEWRLFPEFDEAGTTNTVLAIARDITEAKISGEALKNSEERLKLAVEATSLGLWDWNLETNEVFYSPIYFKMLGYEPDELPQELETWHRLLHPNDLEYTLKVVDNSIKNQQEAFEIEFRMLCKDGSYKWLCGRGQASDIGEDGHTTRIIGTHEDITNRKRNEEIQKTLFNISNAVNTTKNLNELYEKIREYLGRIVDTTNCFLAIYNPESKMLTMPFHRDELDSFTEFPAGKTFTGYVISTGKAQLIDAKREKQLMEEGLIEPFGSPCVSWLGVPLKADSKTIGVFVVQSYHEDIVYTREDVNILEFVSDQIALAIERKRDQDNVLDSQERQRRIFESSPDPIIVVNPDGIVIDYNTGLLTALHITNEPVIGQNIFHFIDKRHWRIAISNFRKTWLDGYIKNLEFQLRRADGSLFYSEVSTGAIYNNEGDPESMVIIFKNITERKEAERSLREAKEKAEESDRLKTAFLSNMSHEIRTPMNAIVGFSDLLNDATITASERSEFIAQINIGADNLIHLIDDILDIAKIEAGQIKINKHECHLRKLVDEQMVMFRQNIERMDKTGLDFHLSWNLPSETVVLRTDPFRVKQIITNLLNNALKFTDEGFVVLGVEAEDNIVRIYVRDTGIGIDKEKLGVIFDRFMQGHRSQTKLYGGTGLGLAISKNLAELLGGEIGVKSVPGEGSEFWFTIPYDKVESANEIKERVVLNATPVWKGKKILVAEDDVANFHLISELLKHTNAEIIWARNGKETLDLVREHNNSLNLILMDIQMPEIDGYECTRIVKQEHPELPVIAQTAYAMSGESEMSREAGCDDYVSKPIQIKELIEKISFFLK